tara:strand:- start:690 stop:1250 length:561 start_codon:yes stop_codon:yes gene_type:complete
MDNPDWLMWSAELSPETCDQILELCRQLPVKKATTFRTGEDEEDHHRKTDVRWVPNEGDYIDLHKIVTHYALQANMHFGLALSHLPALQFTEYTGVGHHYDFHHDIDWGRQDGFHRKLSIIIQLTDPEDYEGGEFSFKHIENPDRDTVRQRGTILCFLPYHEHAVAPIASGNRTSLVAWFEGPRWR